MKRIGILTAGNIRATLNAVIHGSIVRANPLEVEIIGAIEGFNGLFSPWKPHLHLNPLYKRLPRTMLRKYGRTLFAAGDVARPYHSVNTDAHKRICYLNGIN